MIKVAISGADTPRAGELIRILAGHPDVVLECAQATGLEGLPVASHHHGLIGETSLNFSKSIDLRRSDVLFVCGAVPTNAQLAEYRAMHPGLKIIIFPGECSQTEESVETIATVPFSDNDEESRDGLEMEQCKEKLEEESVVVFGLPEINRKALVRGATTALLPHPLLSMCLVALYPAGMNMLLSGNAEIHITAPEDIVAGTDTTALASELESRLRDIQKGFAGSVKITTDVSSTRRTGLMSMTLDCGINLDHILRIYEIYDDHHFAFPLIHRVGVSEVAGTNKCVISIEKPEPGKLRLGAAADIRLRGGAGEAVHVMNLMFGLHEKTGLALKAIDFYPINAD